MADFRFALSFFVYFVLYIPHFEGQYRPEISMENLPGKSPLIIRTLSCREPNALAVTQPG